MPAGGPDPGPHTSPPPKIRSTRPSSYLWIVSGMKQKEAAYKFRERKLNIQGNWVPSAKPSCYHRHVDGRASMDCDHFSVLLLNCILILNKTRRVIKTRSQAQLMWVPTEFLNSSFSNLWSCKLFLDEYGILGQWKYAETKFYIAVVSLSHTFIFYCIRRLDRE